MHEAPKASSWWGERSGITVGQTHASGRNLHWGRTFGRSAARRVSPLSQGRRRGTSEQEGGRGLRPSEENEGPGWFARTSCFRCRSLQATSGLE
jgi:hypothetical protein